MKIFYFTELLSPYRIEWMNELSKNNDITVCSINEAEKTRNNKWLACVEKRFTVLYYKKFFNSDKKNLFKYILENGFEIFIIDGYSRRLKLSLLFFLLKNNKKVFINVDGIDVWRKPNFKDFLKGFIKRKVYKSGAKFLCGSKIAAERIIENGADKNNITIHPFTSLHEKDIITYDNKVLMQLKYKKELGFIDKKLVIAVGRFIPLKQYDVLLKAWENMPSDYELLLIGEGEERAYYESIIERLSIKNVRILDFMLPDELKKYYYAADLFVHTSSTETWGLVINEAMAKGVPVIATNHCVAGVELIREGIDGYIIGVGAVDALKEKIINILSDDALKGEMMKNVLNRIAPYTFERQAEIHNEIFKN